MIGPTRRLTAALAGAVLVVACGGPPNPTASPTPAISATAQPTATPAAGATSSAQAVALVLASDLRFMGIGPPNSDLIGACCSYDVAEEPPGWNVTIEAGWGDCEAGCISHHKWLFHVDPDATLSKLDETGDEPVRIGQTVEARPAQVRVLMGAGPVCPAQPVPPPAECEPRPVANAELVLRDPHGVELARTTSDEQGVILFNLPTGAYFVEPQPVEGLLGAPAPLAFSVLGGASLEVHLDYDTGIR